MYACMLMHTLMLLHALHPVEALMKGTPEPPDMSDTSIRVSHELADELFDRKENRGESYEDVIWRLIEIADEYDESQNSEQNND